MPWRDRPIGGIVTDMANARSASRLALTWQPSLLDPPATAPGFDAQFATAARVELEPGAWIEHAPRWCHHADSCFAAIVARAPWEQRRVRVYDRTLDEPRLTAWYGTPLDDPSLPPFVPAMAAALSARYGRTFDGAGAALYRDGRDSVAWHGDRIPAEVVDPVVAILSLGSPRTLRMRAKLRHSDTRAFRLAPGDLFVMGGTSQRTWEHAVPKVRAAGPRLSLQFRHSR